MPYNSPAGLIAMSVILAFIADTCVAIRFYSRRNLKAKIGLGADDWLILAAAVVGTGMAAMEIYGAAVQALGVPLNATIEDPRAVDGRLNKTKHIELSFILLGVLGSGLIKLSVSFLVRRIFYTVRPFRIVMNVWIAILVGWTLAWELAGLLECGSHLGALFGTPQDYLDHCGSSIPAGYSWVGSNVATDLITILLPLPVLAKLQMPLGRKFLVAGNFLVGFLSVGASIGKAYIYIAATKGLYHEDAIITLTALSVWNFVEVQVGIVAACGHALRPYISSLAASPGVTRLLSSLRHTSGTSGSRSPDTVPATPRQQGSRANMTEEDLQWSRGKQAHEDDDSSEMEHIELAAPGKKASSLV